MIRLTNTTNESEWIAPEQIRNIRKDNGSLPLTRVFLDSGNYVLVTESPKEVARKVLEWRLAMIDYHHDIPSVKTKAMAELAKLAGLEE